MLRASPALPLVILAVALSGCGESGGADEEAAVKETIVAAAMTRDPADCERLHTRDLLERMAFGFEGERAVQACEEIVMDEGVEAPREVTVSGLRVGDGEATAEASFAGSSLDGQTIAISLVEEGGRWKIDRLVEFVEFDRARLLERMKRAAREVDDPFEAKVAPCMAERVAGLNDEELQDIVLYNDPEGTWDIALDCLREVENKQTL
ncbi:MAG TPA: hypothetical protein VFY69_05680 [Solirubrobacterales bacterium]|nr:hypothetical protein [Solirubrobacterales bacterium]